jgi:hypothetical protein
MAELAEGITHVSKKTPSGHLKPGWPLLDFLEKKSFDLCGSFTTYFWRQYHG